MKDERTKFKKNRQPAPDPRRLRSRERRHERTHRPAPPPRTQKPSADDAPFDPEAFRERFMRDFINDLGFPPYCEEKPCRRERRCVGAYEPGSFGVSVACYQRHREQLQPIFADALREILKASQAARESEY